MHKRTQLILALDVRDEERAVSISEDVAGCVDAIKVGYPLVLGAGLGIINTISDFTGCDSLAECIRAGKEYNGDIYVVTEMSHPGALDFMQPAAEALVRLELDSRAAGIIAPATRPERVKQIRSVADGLTIISPGVGAQGASAADTIRAEADYVIAGRSIYNAEHPEIDAEKIVREIEQCR